MRGHGQGPAVLVHMRCCVLNPARRECRFTHAFRAQMGHAAICFNPGGACPIALCDGAEDPAGNAQFSAEPNIQRREARLGCNRSRVSIDCWIAHTETSAGYDTLVLLLPIVTLSGGPRRLVRNPAGDVYLVGRLGFRCSSGTFRAAEQDRTHFKSLRTQVSSPHLSDSPSKGKAPRDRRTARRSCLARGRVGV